LITNYLRKFRPGHLTLCHMLCHCNAMQPDETPGNPGSPADPRRPGQSGPAKNCIDSKRGANFRP